MEFSSRLAWKLGLVSFVMLGTLTGCQTTRSSGHHQATMTTQQQRNTYTRDIQAAAHRGDPDAMYALGYMYYYGDGVKQNVDTAKRWIAKSARQNHPLALIAIQALQGVSDAQYRKLDQLLTDSNRHHAAVKKPTAVAVKQTAPQALPANLPTQAKALPKRVAASHPVMTTKVTVPASSYYTIQVFANHDRQAAVKYIQSRHLEHKAIYHHTQSGGQAWYVVLYGEYLTKHQAELAKQHLPAELKRGGPWVRRIQMKRSS